MVLFPRSQVDSRTLASIDVGQLVSTKRVTFASYWAEWLEPCWTGCPWPYVAGKRLEELEKSVMAGKAEQMKGTAKEAVGAAVGSEDLKAEGKADRQAGEVKEQVGKVEGKVEGLIDKAKGLLHPKK